jgi:hypothetical protein
MSDDVFALTMNIFDRFILKSSSFITDRSCQLIALSCYNLAKKLRTNISINNENEQTSLILFNENYNDEEIFVGHFQRNIRNIRNYLFLEYRTIDC